MEAENKLDNGAFLMTTWFGVAGFVPQNDSNDAFVVF